MGSLESSKNCVIVRPTKHIVRGFLFERTAYKDCYYVWELIVPLFSPTETISLNYSNRVTWSQGHGQILRLSETPQRQISSEELAIFERRISGSLSKISTAVDFLRRFPLEDTRPNIIFEHAVAHWLIGDLAAARKTIEILEKSSTRDRQLVARFPFSEEIIAALKNSEDAQSSIKGIEEENVKRKFPKITVE